MIVRMILPFIYNWYKWGSPFKGLDLDGIIYMLVEVFGMGILTAQNYLFIMCGLVDFQRRSFMVNYCGALINPFKDNYSFEQCIIPTINLTCKHSIRSWFLMR